jgi:thiol:disulfide interchange protein DsbA
MNLNRLFALACLLFVTALPSAFAELKEGRDYRLVPTPQPVANPAKIEVLEFFWYACPHCNDVQPALKKWKAAMPKDVDFRVMPAVFRPNWEPLAKTYYALEAMGIESRLRDKIFEAIHLDQINLSDEKVQLDWMAKQGVDRQKFAEAYNAFAMQSKVARSKQAGRDYDIHGTPTLVVDGKYITSPAMTGGNEAVIPVLNELIEKARADRAAKAKK